MSELKIAFLNVGHGDFCYCETPNSENMIIDCGSEKDAVVPSEFLKKVSTINELQISHPHTDHFLDIEEISKKEIKSFRCPNPNSFENSKIGWKKSDESKIKKLKELYRTIKPDDGAIQITNGFGHWLYYPSFDKTDPNTSSIITILSYKNDKVIMAGDLMATGWEEMLKKKDFLNAIKGTTVLKASHHGRENGFCSALFDHISPSICIISDKSLDKDNENTSCTDKYTKAVKDGGGGIEFFRTLDGVSVGTRYVLTTRNDNSIFIKISASGLYIKTHTNWE